jgi:hypothetical protein
LTRSKDPRWIRAAARFESIFEDRRGKRQVGNRCGHYFVLIPSIAVT